MKYKLTAQVTVSCYCEVDAESESDAIAKAEELTPAMHFNGSGTTPDENWLVEEIDGTPNTIRAELA